MTAYQVCEACDKPFTRKTTRGYSRQRFCSNTCYLKHRRAKVYSTTAKHIDALYSTQRGKCAICLSALKNSQAIKVDHDHTTGQVRGLLCGNCNLKLGWFEKHRYRIQSYVGG